MSDLALPPVLLLHGWGGSFAATFGRTGWPERLREANRIVVSPDLPGHGPGIHSHAPADYADIAASLAMRIPGGPLDAVGFSLGGKLILELAIREPTRFRRIVVGGIGDNLFAPERMGEAVAEALEGASRDIPAGVRAMRDHGLESGGDPLALAAVLRRSPNPVITPGRLSEITTDILILNGDKDLLAIPDGAFRHALPNGRLLRLSGVDHLGLAGNRDFIREAIAFVQHTGDDALPTGPRTGFAAIE